jgi:hypothetical protein
MFRIYRLSQQDSFSRRNYSWNSVKFKPLSLGLNFNRTTVGSSLILSPNIGVDFRRLQTQGWSLTSKHVARFEDIPGVVFSTQPVALLNALQYKYRNPAHEITWEDIKYELARPAGEAASAFREAMLVNSGYGVDAVNRIAQEPGGHDKICQIFGQLLYPGKPIVKL